jgi:hypothetical protein
LRSDLLTSSRLKDARACARLHHLRYNLGYRPVVSADTLRFGTLVHLGLEAWWLAPQGERLEAALAALEGAEVDVYEVARARVMLRGYDARWGSAQYEVLGVEVPFVTELRNPATGAASRTWRLAGKVDAIVRDLSTGLVMLVEHKTSGEDITPGGEYWRRLRMDSQISVYVEGARSLGFEVDGCVYDVLGKPRHKPLKATPMESRKVTRTGELYSGQRAFDETPEEFEARLTEAVAASPSAYFVRGEVVRLEEDMRDALFDIWQTGQAIRESELQGRHPRNSDACTRYGRTCPFFAACSGEASLEGNPDFVVLEDMHPELSDVPAAAQREEATP